MNGKKRVFDWSEYLAVSDLTEAEKKEIWDYIYENSSEKKGEHNLKFAVKEYMHCMRRDGAIENMLQTCEDEGEFGHGFRNDPLYISTLIVYAE